MGAIRVVRVFFRGKFILKCCLLLLAFSKLDTCFKRLLISYFKKCLIFKPLLLLGRIIFFCGRNLFLAC
ncbi:unnamed protein product [Moneuplotes crassus]|uniref:Uncharacterized protein n=1 Tax=Euplotes crassus TaxID=5936 RepID=A0AAD1XVR8_EUPCR|nr:unnamed protein product [Moneuplotes crassus]